MKIHWSGGLGLAVLAAGAIGVWPDIQAKTSAQKNDRSIALAMDWEDVSAYQLNLKTISPKRVMVFPPTGRKEDERIIRESQWPILWRLGDDMPPEDWAGRFRPGDGVFIAGEHTLEHPALLRMLPGLIHKNGFLTMMEFVSNPLLPVLANQVKDHLIKSHTLSSREMLTPKPSLWESRLTRAVEERWVRLLVVRFCPAWDKEQNLNFQNRVIQQLRDRGYVVGGPQPFHRWDITPFGFNRQRLALLVGILVPVLIIIGSTRAKAPPLVIFLCASGMSLLGGTLVQGLAAGPDAVVGLAAMHGVKLQLILPLILSLPFVFSKSEINKQLEIPIKLKHVVFGLVMVGGLAGIYVMRSGNFPKIPVSDAERGFRDTLEMIFVARPRFKECLFGHPLFIIGASLKQTRGPKSLIGRWLLWVGLIGQISIINTFTHFHTPFSISLLRSLHGIWVGIVVAVGGLLLLHSFNRSRSLGPTRP